MVYEMIFLSHSFVTYLAYLLIPFNSFMTDRFLYDNGLCHERVNVFSFHTESKCMKAQYDHYKLRFFSGGRWCFPVIFAVMFKTFYSEFEWNLTRIWIRRRFLWQCIVVIIIWINCWSFERYLTGNYYFLLLDQIYSCISPPVLLTYFSFCG